MASKSCNQLFTDKFLTVFKLFRHRVNASSDFATVTFFTVFKMCRHRVNAVLFPLTFRLACGKMCKRKDALSQTIIYVSHSKFMCHILKSHSYEKVASRSLGVTNIKIRSWPSPPSCRGLRTVVNVVDSGPPRAFGGPGKKLRNEAPCEQKILSITPFRLAENACQSIS